MSTPAELADFLASVERRAFKHAVYAVRDEQAALDIVQEAMIKLAEYYGDRPVTEFPILFQRILQNSIRNYFRRLKVENARFSLFSSFLSEQNGDKVEVLDVLQNEEITDQTPSPDAVASGRQLIAIIESALQQLPPRQREAFLLRYWEGFDTAETATIMGCTEGSVKTHCARATAMLARLLQQKGIDLTWVSS